MHNKSTNLIELVLVKRWGIKKGVKLILFFYMKFKYVVKTFIANGLLTFYHDNYPIKYVT